jgi:hypothetical protein
MKRLWLALRNWLRRAPNIQQASKLFVQQREYLEAKFFTAASRSGKPRGLRWKECDWDSSVAFARERTTGNLAALVGVTIQFEAIEGSDMEGLPAVGNLRHASAAFFFHQGKWQTIGKALFNLAPNEALEHFKELYEPVSGKN